jgi:hypothetical protein
MQRRVAPRRPPRLDSMVNEIQIWLYPAKKAASSDRSLWQERSLPVLEAARLIRDLKAEPVIDVKDHAPKLPPDGTSLSEAFHLYVAQHPSVVEIGGLDRPFETLRLSDYKEPPSWDDVANSKALGRLLGHQVHRRPNRSGATGLQGRRTFREIQPASPEEVLAVLQGYIVAFIKHRAIHEFFGRLRSGRLSVQGVAEGGLATLEGQTVPSAWWERNIVVHVEAGEIWEFTARNRRDGVRRWSSLRVNPMKILDAKIDPGDIDRTGGQGRPSSMHLVRQRFHERVRNGEIEPKLSAEARYLKQWYDTEYEGHPHLTVKTIENNLRDEYRIADTLK